MTTATVKPGLPFAKLTLKGPRLEPSVVERLVDEVKNAFKDIPFLPWPELEIELTAIDREDYNELTKLRDVIVKVVYPPTGVAFYLAGMTHARSGELLQYKRGLDEVSLPGW